MQSIGARSRARRYRFAHGLRIVERPGLFDLLHGLGDDRIL
ncbi:hypothetical protein [Variovorax sp. KK3]|nr:hypothetical protein [Variovorax sp. KK3]